MGKWGMIILLTLFFGVSTQEKSFKNFEVKKTRTALWVLPSGWRQVFSLVKQEWLNKDLSTGYYRRLREKDGLEKWLNKVLEVWTPTAKERVEVGKMVPETLNERLQDAANRFGNKATATYFSIYLVIDKTGKVLTTYFLVNPLFWDLMHEEELQAVCDTLKHYRLDVSDGLKRHTFGTLKELRNCISKSKPGDGSEAKLKEIYDKQVAVDYGVCCIYRMEFVSSREQQRRDSLRKRNPAYDFRY